MRSRRDSGFAGLAPRSAAFALDYLIIAGYLLLVVSLGAFMRRVEPEVTAALFGNPLAGELTGFVVVTLPVSLYFAVSEASASGATLGKRRLHLRVQDGQGRRLGIRRSLGRTAAKFVPWELSHAAIWQLAFPGTIPQWVPTAALIVVWLLVAANVASVLLDAQRRALYDRIADTRVVLSRPA